MSTFRALLLILAGIFLAQAWDYWRLESTPVVPIVLCIAVGIAFVTIAKSGRAQKWIPERVTALGSNPWTWFVLILVLWLSFVVDRELRARRADALEVHAKHLTNVVEQNLDPFRLVVEKLVLPRRLTKEESESISNELRRFPPVRFTIVYRNNDSEASDFAGDLQTALLNADWILDATYTENIVREGLSFEYTPQEGDTNSLAAKRLREALAMVGFKEGGTGAGLPQLRKPGVLLITVGERRRDSRALPKNWQYPKIPGILPNE